jgi:RNA polymerase sigma-70 factor (ECF subfamily)
MIVAAIPQEQLSPEEVAAIWTEDQKNALSRPLWCILGNVDDVEDALQEVALQLLRKGGAFRGDAKWSSWLHRVAVNEGLSMREKRGIRKGREKHLPDNDLHAVQDMRTPDLYVQRTEIGSVIDFIVGKLPLIYRSVVILTDVNRLPNAEAGEILGLAEGTIKSRRHRARKILRRVLEAHHIESADDLDSHQ